MDNPKHLRLWDCAVCSDDVQEREIGPLPLNEIRTPSGIVPALPGVSQLGHSTFDSSLFDHTNTAMRTPGASGTATPAANEDSLYVTKYHYQSHSTQDRGRYDRPVQLRLQRKSAYGDLDEMAPLSPAKLHTPAVLATSVPVYDVPTPRKKADSLYVDGPASAPQMLLDATQALAQDVLQTLSPAKSSRRDPLLRKPASTGISGTVMSFIPSYLSSLWSSADEEPGEPAQERVQVTQSLQQRVSSPPTFGGAYAPSPYRIPRPSFGDTSNFASPSHTPYTAPTHRR